MLFVCLSATSALSAGPGQIEQLRRLAVELVNDARRTRGLDPLTLSEPLNAAATAHAKDMYERRYFAHESPEGDDVQDRYIAAGGNRWRLVAENIATCEGCSQGLDAGDIRRNQRGWMNSKEHRENILREGLTHFGFGIVEKSGREYAVQTFSGPGVARGGSGPAASNPVGPQQQASQALQLINDARTAAGVAPLARADDLSRLAQDFAVTPPAGPDLPDNPAEALSARQRNDWRAIAVHSATCGGCGASVVEQDVAWFIRRWLEDPASKSRLTRDGLTHLGFRVGADGEGAKVAILVLGARR